MALTLHYVQPQEYIKYFEDYNLSLTPGLDKRDFFKRSRTLSEKERQLPICIGGLY